MLLIDDRDDDLEYEIAYRQELEIHHDEDDCPHCDEFGDVHLEGGFYTVKCNCGCHG